LCGTAQMRSCPVLSGMIATTYCLVPRIPPLRNRSDE